MQLLGVPNPRRQGSLSPFPNYGYARTVWQSPARPVGFRTRLEEGGGEAPLKGL